MLLSTLTDQRKNIVTTDAAKRFGRNNSKHTINKSEFVNLIMITKSLQKI